MNNVQQIIKGTKKEELQQNPSETKLRNEIPWKKNNRENFIKKEPTVLQKAFGMCAP